MWATTPHPRHHVTTQPLPALASGDPSAWDQALYVFLVEKGNCSGSRRTVESYSRMLWPFFAELGKTPERVKPADVLAWVHGIGKSGRTPSGTTVGARIACLSSFYRFLIRMGQLVSNPCNAVERPRRVRRHCAPRPRASTATAPPTRSSLRWRARYGPRWRVLGTRSSSNRPKRGKTADCPRRLGSMRWLWLGRM